MDRPKMTPYLQLVLYSLMLCLWQTPPPPPTPQLTRTEPQLLPPGLVTDRLSDGHLCNGR